jgi:hypothetical protein
MAHLDALAAEAASAELADAEEIARINARIASRRSPIVDGWRLVFAAVPTYDGRLLPNPDDVPLGEPIAPLARPDAPDEGRAGPPNLWREWRLPAELVPTWEAAEAAVLERERQFHSAGTRWR